MSARCQVPFLRYCTPRYSSVLGLTSSASDSSTSHRGAVIVRPEVRPQVRPGEQREVGVHEAIVTLAAHARGARPASIG